MKTWEHLSHDVDTSNVGRVVPNYVIVLNKSESKFLIVKVKYSQSHERLGSCLVMEHSKMIARTLFECGLLHLASS